MYNGDYSDAHKYHGAKVFDDSKFLHWGRANGYFGYFNSDKTVGLWVSKGSVWDIKFRSCCCFGTFYQNLKDGDKVIFREETKEILGSIKDQENKHV